MRQRQDKLSYLYQKPSAPWQMIMAGTACIIGLYYLVWLGLFHVESIRKLEARIVYFQHATERSLTLRQNYFLHLFEFRYAFPISSYQQFITQTGKARVAASRIEWLKKNIQDDLHRGVFDWIEIQTLNLHLTMSRECASLAKTCPEPESSVMVAKYFHQSKSLITVKFDITEKNTGNPEFLTLSQHPFMSGVSLFKQTSAHADIETVLTLFPLSLFHRGAFKIQQQHVYFRVPQSFLAWRVGEYACILLGSQLVLYLVSLRNDTLQRGYKLMQDILAHTPELLWLKDLQGRYRMINRIAALRLFSRFPEDVIGHTDLDLFQAEDRDLADVCIESDVRTRHANDTKTHTTYESGIVQGDPLFLIVSKRLFRDNNGRVLGVLGTARDVTHEKEVEQDLMQYKLLIRTLMDKVNAFVYAKDIKGRFILVNKKLCEFHHHEAAWFLGKTDFDLHPPEMAEIYAKDEQRVFRYGETLEQEETLIDPNTGEERIMKTTKIPVTDENGHIIALVGLNFDINQIAQEKNDFARLVTLLKQDMIFSLALQNEMDTG